MFARVLFARPVSRIAVRQFSVTARRRFASDGPPDLERFMQDPKMRDMMEKISRHPPAITAMQRITEVVQSKGYDTGKMPGKMELLKLMMDKEFRDAAKNLTEEMQKAGVELDPQAMMQMMDPKGSDKY